MRNVQESRSVLYVCYSALSPRKFPYVQIIPSFPALLYKNLVSSVFICGSYGESNGDDLLGTEPTSIFKDRYLQVSSGGKENPDRFPEPPLAFGPNPFSYPPHQLIMTLPSPYKAAINEVANETVTTTKQAEVYVPHHGLIPAVCSDENCTSTIKQRRQVYIFLGRKISAGQKLFLLQTGLFRTTV